MIALIGANPVPLASRIDRLRAVLAQEEGAERSFEAQDVRLLHLSKRAALNGPP